MTTAKDLTDATLSAVRAEIDARIRGHLRDAMDAVDDAKHASLGTVRHAACNDALLALKSLEELL